jgi:carbon monoxide dehydrogenase subunit G
MEQKNEQRIDLSQIEVWQALNDPEVLKRCIPLCESVKRVGEREFHIAMVAAIGPVRARFTAKLEYTQLQAPDSCSMVFEASGGSAGFSRGSAELALIPQGNSTLLTYQVKAQVGGKLAQIGSRLVDAAARKIADGFFAKFNEAVLTPPPADIVPHPAKAV